MSTFKPTLYRLILLFYALVLLFAVLTVLAPQ
jgi:hypothetical protein